MKLIRNNVFETNSSSCHSLSVVSGNYVDDSLSYLIDDHGTLMLTGGAFGCGEEVYCSASMKVAYLATQAVYGYDYRDNDGNSKREIFKNNLIEVLKEVTKCNEVFFDIDEDSYINHQSDELGLGLTKEQIKDFIFNQDSYLVISNDNGGVMRINPKDGTPYNEDFLNDSEWELLDIESNPNVKVF